MPPVAIQWDDSDTRKTLSKRIQGTPAFHTENMMLISWSIITAPNYSCVLEIFAHYTQQQGWKNDTGTGCAGYSPVERAAHCDEHIPLYEPIDVARVYILSAYTHPYDTTGWLSLVSSDWCSKQWSTAAVRCTSVWVRTLQRYIRSFRVKYFRAKLTTKPLWYNTIYRDSSSCCWDAAPNIHYSTTRALLHVQISQATTWRRRYMRVGDSRVNWSANEQTIPGRTKRVLVGGVGTILTNEYSQELR